MLTNKHRFGKQSLLLPAVLLSALTVVGPAQAQVGPAPRGTAQFEQWVRQEVNHELVMLPWYSVWDNLQYTVKGSEVTLQGQVLEDTTKSEAEKRVKGIEGVTKVIDNIEVLPPSPNDDRIRRAVYRAIFGDPVLQMYSFGSVQPVHIVVKGGHVTLEGSVLNQGHKNLAGIRANGVSGIFSVTNNLRIENSKSQSEADKRKG
jgi:hyperosmotically inducible protein